MGARCLHVGDDDLVAQRPPEDDRRLVDDELMLGPVLEDDELQAAA